MVKADNDQLYPGDEVKLKFGDFPVVITRRNLMLNKRHFDYAGERKDKAKDNYLLFDKKDIDFILKIGQSSIHDYLKISFWDTLEKLEYPALKKLTYNAIVSTRVYKAGFYATDNKTLSLNGFAKVNVLKMTAFDAARYFHPSEKTAVVNFANPLIPGGNVKEGGTSQEESLCRTSCLYPCLCREDLQKEFYEENRLQKNNWFTDKVMYTSGVTVFKNDSIIPREIGWKNWLMLDIISAATPYCLKDRYISKTVVRNIFIPRIRNILEVAIDNAVTVLVAGAFGCGLGGFDPKIVASAFLYLLREEEYITKFNQIVFAISSPTHEYSEALNIFSQTFAGDWYNSKKDILSDLLMPPGNNLSYYLPNGKKLEGIVLESYIRWRTTNPYFSKKISIIRDEISTLQGYNPSGAKVFYGGDNSNFTGIATSMHTWWGMLIDFFGSELLINSAWTGSMVTKSPDQSLAFPAASSMSRTRDLHQMNVVPEVIIIYIGSNDWLKGIKAVKENRKRGIFGKLFRKKVDEKPDFSVFDDAYGKMLSRLRHNYPKAEIWCCTLTASFMSQNPAFIFPLSYGGENIETYNKCIRKRASEYGCRLIDFYQFGIPYDSIDGNHPNIYGMRALAYMGIISMADEQGKSYFK